MELKAYPLVNVGNKNQTPEIEFFLYCLEKLLTLKPVFVVYKSKLLELWVALINFFSTHIESVTEDGDFLYILWEEQGAPHGWYLATVKSHGKLTTLVYHDHTEEV